MATTTVVPLQEESLDQWMRSRHKWLQTAAARLLRDQKRPDEGGIRDLAALCVAEASKDPGAVFESMPKDALSSHPSAPKLTLIDVTKVHGVNAIFPGATLSFEDADLTVVFGANGSGKSGFARLLKHACGARIRKDLQPNVFEARPPTPSAEFRIALDGKPTDPISWQATTGPLSRLRHVHVFDAHTATTYVTAKNESAYEPRVMRILGTLLEISDLVEKELLRQIASLPRTFPPLPKEWEGTPTHTFLLRLAPDTPPEAVRAATTLPPDAAETRAAIELSLRQQDIPARLRTLDQQKRRLAQLRTEFTTLMEGYSEGKLKEIATVRKDAQERRIAAKVDAGRVFAQSSFEGIAQASWKSLWLAAKEFSEHVAYPGRPFPAVEEGDRCVLCHQVLDGPARTRLTDFERYVRSRLEIAANEAELRLKGLVDRLPAIPAREDWILKMETIGAQVELGRSILAGLEAGHKFALSTGGEAVPPSIIWEPIFDTMAKREGVLGKEEKSLLELQKDGGRAALARKVNEIKALEWLVALSEPLLNELSRLKMVHRLQAGVALAKTQALAKKINEVAKKELSQGYQDRFVTELKALGGKRIQIMPVAVSGGKAPSGGLRKATFELTLQGVERQTDAQAILSEGESRIVSLAAFLADMAGSGLFSPFIFDDPISSLDQEFEERVAERLVDLAQERQVIVFTHRLSLANLLEEIVQGRNDNPCQGEPPIPRIKFITLQRIGKQVGHLAAFDVRTKSPEKGFRFLFNNQLPRVKKFLSARELESWSAETKALCADFRILLERTVEKLLLQDVVLRFRKDVQTKRLPGVTKIMQEDCRLMHELMTRYSGFVHSAPMETPIELPEPEEIGTDLEKILAWIKAFESREV